MVALVGSTGPGSADHRNEVIDEVTCCRSPKCAFGTSFSSLTRAESWAVNQLPVPELAEAGKRGQLPGFQRPRLEASGQELGWGFAYQFLRVLSQPPTKRW